MLVLVGMLVGSNFFCCLLVFIYACNEGSFWTIGEDDDTSSNISSSNVARMVIEDVDNGSYAVITYFLSRSVVQFLFTCYHRKGDTFTGRT